MKCPFLSQFTPTFVSNNGPSLAKVYGQMCPVFSTAKASMATAAGALAGNTPPAPEKPGKSKRQTAAS